MRNSPKDNDSKLDDLKKDLQTISKSDQNDIKGGSKYGWNDGCGDIVPQ